MEEGWSDVNKIQVMKSEEKSEKKKKMVFKEQKGTRKIDHPNQVKDHQLF